MISTSRTRIVLAILMMGLSCCGCSRLFPTSAPASGAGPATPGKDIFPPLSNCVSLEPGICRHEVVVQRAGVPMKVWIYLPGGAAQKLPCVLIGPAGSHLVDGQKLGTGSEDEHLPYVRAGFAVVSFDIDGAWPGDNPSPDQQIDAARSFMAARGGLLNARTALDYALAKVPVIDPQRIYVAGHSSAGTLALLAASTDPRIKACAAFAPATNVEKRVGAQVIRAFNAKIPGFAAFMKADSPSSHLAELRCPVFLFHAEDDDVISIVDTRIFAANLRTTNAHVKVVEVPSGGHYEAMIQKGIPDAIKWFKGLAH